jgi:transposase
VVERGFRAQDFASRLGTSPHSLYAWVNIYGIPAEQRLVGDDQTAKLKRMEGELRRVTEERDILKMAATYSHVQSCCFSSLDLRGRSSRSCQGVRLKYAFIKHGIGRHHPETATGHGCLINSTSESGG